MLWINCTFPTIFRQEGCRCYNPEWMISASPQFFTDSPEIEFSKNLLTANRRLRSQVFTPYSIASIMAHWVMKGMRPQSLLDPAFGLGVFFRASLEHILGGPPELVGYELDGNLAALAKSYFNENGYAHLSIKHEDFITGEWASQYDGILCNPPYQKFRGLAGKQTYVDTIKKFTGLDLSTASNLYIYFLVKAVSQLAEGGRAAFILPYEFLNADYGKVVKQYLLEQGVLRQVSILGGQIRPFKGVITTSCILTLEKAPTDLEPEFVICNTLDELSGAINSPAADQNLNRSKIQFTGKKWFSPGFMRLATPEARLIPLSTYGKVMRGIATGDNAFFVLRESQRLQAGLDKNSLLPCLSKADLAMDSFFTVESFETLVNTDKPAWLLNAVNGESPGVKEYLDRGLLLGTHLRYLTRNRSTWYMMERKPQAPLLATTFSRSGIRWVRNLAGVSHLTAFHGFYPNQAINIDHLHAYLVTPVAQKIFSLNQRDVGNGLHKFEPNDLNQALVVNFSLIPNEVIKQISEIYTDLKTNQAQKSYRRDKIYELNEIFERYLEMELSRI